MKKVLFIVNHDIVIYNFRKELVQKLIEEKYEVYIVSPMGDRIPFLVDMGAKHINIQMERRGANPFRDLKLLKEYKKIIKEVQPNVVLTYTIKPNIYGGLAAKSLRVPYIANITGLGTAVENKGLLQKITIGLYKKAFKKIDTVFFQNQENMNFFIENKISNPKKYILLPGSGVNLKEFGLMHYPKDNVTKFVFIGRLMKEKGIDYYLRLAKDIKSMGYKSEFHICGFAEENYIEKIEKLQKENVIKYHGLVTDMNKILKDIHCTIHPSYYPEGISNVLLESAATGKPLITFDRSGLKEVVNHNENGYIVPLHDYDKLLESTISFINLSYHDKLLMGQKGREKVELEFDRNLVTEKYLNRINNL